MSELACTHESLHETEGRYGLAAASGCFGGRLVAGGGADWEICSSHCSQRGRYQLREPSSFIVAGSSRARTMGPADHGRGRGARC